MYKNSTLVDLTKVLSSLMRFVVRVRQQHITRSNMQSTHLSQSRTQQASTIERAVLSSPIRQVKTLGKPSSSHHLSETSAKQDCGTTSETVAVVLLLKRKTNLKKTAKTLSAQAVLSRTFLQTSISTLKQKVS